MINFIIGCAFLALCLYIGGAVLTIVFGVFFGIIGAVGSVIKWLFDSIKG